MHNYPYTYAELVRMPDRVQAEQTTVHILASHDNLRLDTEQFAEIHITDHATPNWFDASVGRISRHNWKTDEWKPKPITAFLRTTLPSNGLMRLTFFPRKIEHVPPELPAAAANAPFQTDPAAAPGVLPTYTWRYYLPEPEFRPPRWIPSYAEEQYRVLPGTIRTLLLNIPYDDITATPAVIAFSRYEDPDLLVDDPPQVNPDQPRYPVHTLPINLPAEHRRFDAVAWDETVGRLCLSHLGKSRVEVFDFSRRPKEGEC
jgi:hypothetical protein